MFDTITIAIFIMALSAVAAALLAIGNLSTVKKRLTQLGVRVLESDDIGKIKEAADKVESYESRIAGCEHKADESQNKLSVHDTKLSELADKLAASEQKTASLEARLDELSTRLESVGQKAKKNEDGLAQTVPNIKALADEIQSIKKFQTATEKIHGLIQSAFDDMQVSSPSEQVPVTAPEASTPEDAPQGPEEWHEEAKDQEMSGSRRWHQF